MATLPTDTRDNPGPAKLSVEQSIKAIIRYCEGCVSHGPLSTVAMLADDALEAYRTEKKSDAECIGHLVHSEFERCPKCDK